MKTGVQKTALYKYNCLKSLLDQSVLFTFVFLIMDRFNLSNYKLRQFQYKNMIVECLLNKSQYAATNIHMRNIVDDEHCFVQKVDPCFIPPFKSSI